MEGVAPKATIIAEKVLNASGSGYDTDVANGITKAANAGAQVISLSLTYIPTASVVNAINYAASKGAVVVFAGGNSSAALDGGANTTGLTAAAQARLIFVGSVSATNTLSSFSNTPGAGSVVVGATKTSYASMWLMAPGESIVAPGIQYGSGAYAYWTGTSMAAPMVAGAVALLETTWPVLGRNGTAAAVLFKTATDLGTVGTDATYGDGLLNLTKAFQPVGTLAVNTVSGQSIPVAQVTSTTLTSGALGNLSAIRAKLTSYTAFDTFQRNFSVNLSGLISSSSTSSAGVSSLIAPSVVSRVTHLVGGGSMTLASSALPFAGGGQSAPVDASLQLAERTLGTRDPSVFLMSMTTAAGTTVAAGRGLSSASAFAGAMWGGESAAAVQAQQTGASDALMDLAQGGYFAAAGAYLGAGTRVALSWSATPTAEPWSNIPGQALIQPHASAVSVGVTRRLTGRWSLGATVTALSESNGLLGADSNPQGLLGFGAQHRSSSIGLATTYDLGGGRALMLDASLSRTSGSGEGGGLIGQVTPVTARAFGAAFLQADAFRPGDHLSVSVRKPLRVMGGSAQLAVTTVDSEGYATTSLVRVGLKPSGDETDVALAYATPLKGGADMSFGLSVRSDADNVHGLTDAVARLAFNKAF